MLTEPRFEPLGLEVLFDAPFYNPAAHRRHYDITPDGQRFLMIGTRSDADEGAVSPRINVVLNWFEELKQRVPTGGRQ